MVERIRETRDISKDNPDSRVITLLQFNNFLYSKGLITEDEWSRIQSVIYSGQRLKKSS